MTQQQYPFTFLAQKEEDLTVRLHYVLQHKRHENCYYQDVFWRQRPKHIYPATAEKGLKILRFYYWF